LPSPELRPLLAKLPLVELGALVLTGLLCLLFHARLPSQLVAEDDYRQVASTLSAEARPGDVLLLQPWWTERARLFAPDGLPVIGYLGSDGDPLTAYSRVWVLSQPSLPRSDVAGFEQAFLPGRVPLGEARVSGNLSLRLYRNDRRRSILFSAADAFASARVYLEAQGQRRDCPFDGRAHRCPGGIYVAQEWHELKFQPRHCLYMRAPGGPVRLVAEFPDVPAGDKLSLEGGVIWEHASSHGPNVTTLHFGVDDAVTGQTVLDLAVPPGLEGAQRTETKLANAATLKLWVESERPDSRESCFDLFSLGPAEAP
jgi:hypothetical protein